MIDPPEIKTFHDFIYDIMFVFYRHAKLTVWAVLFI